ncbi:MAG: hypothetical protein KTR14_09325 [Vampirovibrio sp.]|nr:hypothetical protein [Vampirovibrio sp.]
MVSGVGSIGNEAARGRKPASLPGTMTPSLKKAGLVDPFAIRNAFAADKVDQGLFSAGWGISAQRNDKGVVVAENTFSGELDPNKILDTYRASLSASSSSSEAIHPDIQEARKIIDQWKTNPKKLEDAYTDQMLQYDTTLVKLNEKLNALLKGDESKGQVTQSDIDELNTLAGLEEEISSLYLGALSDQVTMKPDRKDMPPMKYLKTDRLVLQASIEKALAVAKSLKKGQPLVADLQQEISLITPGTFEKEGNTFDYSVNFMAKGRLEDIRQMLDELDGRPITLEKEKDLREALYDVRIYLREASEVLESGFKNGKIQSVQDKIDQLKKTTDIDVTDVQDRLDKLYRDPYKKMTGEIDAVRGELEILRMLVEVLSVKPD